LDDLEESTDTLPIEEDSDDEVQQFKPENFFIEKEKKRAIRFGKAHERRAKTLQGLNTLYSTVYQITQIQAHIDPSLVESHFDEKSSVPFLRLVNTTQ
jgi:hypothetical protein